MLSTVLYDEGVSENRLRSYREICISLNDELTWTEVFPQLISYDIASSISSFLKKMSISDLIFTNLHFFDYFYIHCAPVLLCIC